MKLYSYFRSSAAYRVRIALNLKALEYDIENVNLLEQAHLSENYLSVNPSGLVPALEISKGRVLSQSPAILEWLEETYPEPALLPSNRYERAKVRAAVNTIVCDIHPINNLRVLRYLSRELNSEKEQNDVWYRHWICCS